MGLSAGKIEQISPRKIFISWAYFGVFLLPYKIPKKGYTMTILSCFQESFPLLGRGFYYKMTCEFQSYSWNRFEIFESFNLYNITKICISVCVIRSKSYANILPTQAQSSWILLKISLSLLEVSPFKSLRGFSIWL